MSVVSTLASTGARKLSQAYGFFWLDLDVKKSNLLAHLPGSNVEARLIINFSSPVTFVCGKVCQTEIATISTDHYCSEAGVHYSTRATDADRHLALSMGLQVWDSEAEPQKTHHLSQRNVGQKTRCPIWSCRFRCTTLHTHKLFRCFS